MSNNGQSAKRASFSGKIGYVLAVAGSAVGLGNIWRFPYLAAKYGGGIFLLVYLVLTVSFGYVLIMSETALGRMTRKSPVGAFQTFGKTKSFKIGGWLNAIIPMLIVPYYSSIGGWVIKYLAEYLKGNVQTVAQDGYFTEFISDSFQVEAWFIVFSILVFCVILAGVENGIERVSKIMMPILVILVCGHCHLFGNEARSTGRCEIFSDTKHQKLLLDDSGCGNGTDVLLSVNRDGNFVYIWFLYW